MAYALPRHDRPLTTYMTDIVTIDGEPLPWERQPNEPETAWQYFCAYRDMERPRSLSKLATALGLNGPTVVGRMSMDRQWQARLLAYDSWLEQQRRQAVAEEVQARARQHAESLDAAITVLAAPAIAAAERIKQQGGLNLPDGANPADILRLVTETSKVLPQLIQASRLVNGMSTENVDVHGLGAGASPTSDEEMQAFLTAADDGSAGIAGKLAAPAPDAPLEGADAPEEA